jgi:acyl-CoA thioesterase-1
MLKIILGVGLTWMAGVSWAGTVLIFGDSLSAGYGLGREEAWPVLLSQRLEKVKSPYSVVNASISGETTAGGRARLPAVLEQHRPSVVVLELGANDGLRGLSIPQMRANLSQMIQAAKKSGARVLLVGMRMPPNYGLRYTREFETAFADLAREFKLPLVPFLLEGLATNPAFFQADGLHPTALAQPKLLDTVWSKLAPLLKK